MRGRRHGVLQRRCPATRPSRTASPIDPPRRTSLIESRHQGLPGSDSTSAIQPASDASFSSFLARVARAIGPSPPIRCCRSAAGRRKRAPASVPDLTLSDLRDPQRALLARADQHVAKELAFRRVNERVGLEDGRQVWQRAPRREQNAGTHHGEAVLFELSDHRAHGTDRQPRGTVPALTNQGVRPVDTQPLSRMIGLLRTRNRGVGGLDPASFEDDRSDR